LQAVQVAPIKALQVAVHKARQITVQALAVAVLARLAHQLTVLGMLSRVAMAV
jgi:hypothetical protein